MSHHSSHRHSVRDTRNPTLGRRESALLFSAVTQAILADLEQRRLNGQIVIPESEFVYWIFPAVMRRLSIPSEEAWRITTLFRDTHHGQEVLKSYHQYIANLKIDLPEPGSSLPKVTVLEWEWQ